VENKWISIGSLWWHPWRGAHEAVLHTIRWREIVILSLLEMVSMAMGSLLATGGRLPSLGSALLVTGAVSLATVAFWIFSVAIIMLCLCLMRRVVLPERLFFVFVVSHIPWIVLFPVMLLAPFVPVIRSLVPLAAWLLSLGWLWAGLRREYAISAGQTLIVILMPGVVLFLVGALGVIRLVILTILGGKL